MRRPIRHTEPVTEPASAHRPGDVPAARALLPLTAAAASAPAPIQPSLYDQLGADFFTELVAQFYRGVAGDPILRALYPEDDLGPAELRFRLFLVQYWGGPTTYSDERGHPRLRRRHHPFAITTTMRDRWLRHMRLAVDSVTLSPSQESLLWDYFERAAHSLVNTETE